MASSLDQLKQMTTVVSDTGDFESIKAYKPQDATTNPSLIFRAVEKPAYRPILDEVIAKNKGSSLSGKKLAAKIVDELLVAFGLRILEIVPGRVSTEVDARLSFDVEGSVAKARELIGLYEKAGISRERVLIKLASTWEGIRAAEICEKEGIFCNMTLLFSLGQAIASAEAGVTLISPFVGRIYDYYKKQTGIDYQGAEDPGVESVRQIFNYYKKFDYDIEIMGASFRNVSQILELAGCDLLTISPNFLDDLSKSDAPVVQKLIPEEAKKSSIERRSFDEKSFRWDLNQDAMATDKLAEGIRVFGADIEKLEKIILASV